MSVFSQCTFLAVSFCRMRLCFRYITGYLPVRNWYIGIWACQAGGRRCCAVWADLVWTVSNRVLHVISDKRCMSGKRNGTDGRAGTTNALNHDGLRVAQAISVNAAGVAGVATPQYFDKCFIFSLQRDFRIPQVAVICHLVMSRTVWMRHGKIWSSIAEKLSRSSTTSTSIFICNPPSVQFLIQQLKKQHFDCMAQFLEHNYWFIYWFFATWSAIDTNSYQ